MRKKLLTFCFSSIILTSLHSQNVGIGTIAPLQKLDINGSVCVNNNTIFLRAGNDSAHGLKFSTGVDGAYLFGFSGGALGAYNNPYALRWDQVGNIGVRASLLVDSGGGNSGNIGYALRFGGWSGEGIGSKRTAGGNQYGLDFYTNGTNRIAIALNGNIGIGTTTPLHKLDINGNVSLNDNVLYLKSGTVNGLKYITGTDGPYLFGWSGGALGTFDLPHTLTWDYNGNVGIRNSLLVDSAADNDGTVSSSLRFGGWGGEGIGSKRTAGGNQYGLDFYTGFTNRVAITGGGNVGIGTTTPTSKLEVNGETKTTSLKVGNNGTSVSTVQKGTFTIGSSAGAFKTVTVNFPNAFASTPVLVVTVKSDPGWNVGDTFVASIRSISNTSVTFNVQRVDAAGGWSQNLLLNWIAME